MFETTNQWWIVFNFLFSHWKEVWSSTISEEKTDPSLKWRHQVFQEDFQLWERSSFVSDRCQSRGRASSIYSWEGKRTQVTSWEIPSAGRSYANRGRAFEDSRVGVVITHHQTCVPVYFTGRGIESSMDGSESGQYTWKIGRHAQKKFPNHQFSIVMLVSGRVQEVDSLILLTFAGWISATSTWFFVRGHDAFWQWRSLCLLHKSSKIYEILSGLLVSLHVNMKTRSNNLQLAECWNFPRDAKGYEVRV